jgi:hypothetical protein
VSPPSPRTLGWFVPRSVLRRVAGLRGELVGCLVALTVGTAAALAVWFSNTPEWAGLGFMAGLLGFAGMLAAARAELLRRGGFPSFTAWWWRALWDAWRTGGPEWTAIVVDARWDARSSLDRVRADGATASADHWWSADGETAESQHLPLAPTQADEIVRHFRDLRDRGWRWSGSSGMCGTAGHPVLWVFARRSLPRRRNADPINTHQPTADAARAVCQDGVGVGRRFIVRVGVGVDDARLGDSEHSVRAAVGRHWPSESWASADGERGITWPRIGLATAFDEGGRCVLFRIAAPAHGQFIGGDNGDHIVSFSFDDLDAFATHFWLRRKWPSTCRDETGVVVPKLGLRLVVEGGIPPTEAELTDRCDHVEGDHARFGVLRAIELRRC